MLGIILVNYKSLEETVDYVQQQLVKISIPYKIVIVNNACTEELNHQLVQQLSGELVRSVEDSINTENRVFVIAEPNNLGYACGNNLGFDFLDRHFNTEWMLISNNDLILEKDGIVEQLIDLGNNLPDTGVIGPQIRTPAGKSQSPHRKRSIWTQLILPKLFYPAWAIWQKFGFGKEVVANANSGYYFRIMGCFFLVRTEAFRECEGFDPRTFLYGEEVILSARMKNIGYETYYSAEQTVIHNHRQSTSSYLSTRNIKQQTLKSMLIYYRHYVKQPSWVCKLAQLADWVEAKIYAPAIDLIKRSTRTRA